MRVARQENVAEEQNFNPYELLGIRKWATTKEIKRAYFGLVRKYSPELFPERFIEIRKAYDALRMSRKRASVDIMLFNEIPGNIGFKGVRVETGSVVKLNKDLRDLENNTSIAQVEKENQKLELLKKRSLVYVKKNYWHEAIEDWNRILALDPNNKAARRNIIQAYGRLGYSYAQNNLLEKAVDSWKQILRLNPNCLEAVHNIAIASTQLKNSVQEKEYWEKTLDLWGERLDEDDGNDYLKNLILETHKFFGGRFMGRKKESESKILTAEVLIDQIGGYRDNKQLGMALMGNKKFAEAVKSFEKCLEEKPEDLEVLGTLGWAYMNSGDYTKCFNVWNKALKIDPDNQTIKENLVKGHLQVGKQMRNQKAFGPALVQFKNLLKLVPDQPEVYMEIGSTYAMKGDLRSAIAQWEKVLELDPKNKIAQQAMREAKSRIRPG
jgi:tetratricopeptide (TPR) repeat protein